MELKLSRTVRKWLSSMSFKVMNQTDEYMFMPYWFKKESNGKYHLVKWDELSDEIKQIIKERYEENTN
jgi:hypothetical protein